MSLPRPEEAEQVPVVEPAQVLVLEVRGRVLGLVQALALAPGQVQVPALAQVLAPARVLAPAMEPAPV